MLKKNLYRIMLVCMGMALLSGCGKKKNNNENVTEETVKTINLTNKDSNKRKVQELIATTNSGDTIEITTNKKQTNSLDYEKETEVLTVCNSEGKVLQSGSFLTAKWYKEYYDAVMTDCEIIDQDEYANLSYVYYSYKNNEGKIVYEILGWIIGSNSGFVMEGNNNKEETIETFKNLYFRVKESDQENMYYIYDPTFETTTEE